MATKTVDLNTALYNNINYPRRVEMGINSIKIFWGDDAKSALMGGSIVKELAHGVWLVDVARHIHFGKSYAADLEEDVYPELALVFLPEDVL